MAVQDSRAFAQLPKSHVFLTVSRGAAMRTFAVRWFIVYALAGFAPVFGVAGLGSIGYILFHDHLVATLMARQNQMQYAYEDKLDALRGQLERETNRQVSDQATVENRMRDLFSREARLETRSEVVASLARTNERTGLEAAVLSPRILPRHPIGSPIAPAPPQNPLAQLQTPQPELPAGIMSFAPAPGAPASSAPTKPHPEAMVVEPAPRRSRSGDGSAALDTSAIPVKTRLALLAATLDHIEQVQVGAVVHLSSAARAETERLRGVLDDTGLSPERFKADAASGMGGPFVPLPGEKDGAFPRAVESLQTNMQAVLHLRGIVGRVPLAGPLPGTPEVTSTFGPRIDPFLGRPALHTGVDLAQDYGVPARVTAPGRVSFAGPMGGYGNMVEVDHGNGLTSRYAHLSRIVVAEGDAVARGDAVGEVGSTGRATGPHLHYEVRIDGEPVDPQRFLNAGMRLGRDQPHT